MATHYSHLDPSLSPEQADTMLRLAEFFGSFGTYADEASSEGLGEELPQRFDVDLNNINAGIDGRGNEDAPETTASSSAWWHFPARRGGFAPAVARAVWPRRQPCWPMKSFPMYRCGSG